MTMLNRSLNKTNTDYAQIEQNLIFFIRPICLN